MGNKKIIALLGSPRKNMNIAKSMVKKIENVFNNL